MNHDYKKHLLIMLACCLVPLAAILAVSVFGVSIGALQPLVPFALALMCPLMMLGMMWWMQRDRGAAKPPANTQTAPADSKLFKETKASAEQIISH